MKYIVPPVWIFACLCLCLLAAPAWAQSDGGAAPGSLVELYRAVVNGQFGWLSGLAMIAAIEPAKRLLRTRVKFFDTKLGGTALTFLVASITGCAHALLVGVTWDWPLVSAILRNSVVAIGGYTAIKRGLVDRFPWLEKIVGVPLTPPPKATLLPLPAPAEGQ